ncbi:hypothetical protein GUJ93_ZPchr0013g35578 [Zizania palustris]|uniref:Secreted protein n=1 Tax=Zizania palustris TaxID=103762 RepID=A0A8J5WYL8_ZIZPA|nr:hypothetical protein GUJ93_ZPchr0013g35578 [Zizania palustris]
MNYVELLLLLAALSLSAVVSSCCCRDQSPWLLPGQGIGKGSFSSASPKSIMRVQPARTCLLISGIMLRK